jgi:hypothetical protein
MENDNKGLGGCFAALGQILVFFVFFYILYKLLTHPNIFVRLFTWGIVIYGVHKGLTEPI